MPRIVSDIDAAEVILHAGPETNGHVAVKAWEALANRPGATTHLALTAKTRRSATATSRRSPQDHLRPTWSGIESETVSYNAGYQRPRTDPMAHPDRAASSSTRTTLDDRVSVKALAVHRPPVDLKPLKASHNIAQRQQRNPVELHHPHQKWGIHSTYSDNLMMLTLNRGGPIVWLSEDDAGTRALKTTTGSSCSASTAPRGGRW